MKVHLKNKRTWLFVWNDECKGLVHKEGRNVYKLVIKISSSNYNRDEVDIYIGRLYHDKGKRHWINCESEIGVDYMEFLGGNYVK